MSQPSAFLRCFKVQQQEKKERKKNNNLLSPKHSGGTELRGEGFNIGGKSWVDPSGDRVRRNLIDCPEVFFFFFGVANLVPV